jgi:hypothetical protein
MQESHEETFGSSRRVIAQLPGAEISTYVSMVCKTTIEGHLLLLFD